MAKNDRKVIGAIRFNRRRYTTAEADELFEATTEAKRQELKRAKMIEGDWSGKSRADEQGEAPSAGVPGSRAADPRGSPRNPATGAAAGGGTKVGDDFPDDPKLVEALEAAKLPTAEKVKAYVEEGGDLTKLDGIGPAFAKKIREKYGLAEK